MPRRNQQLAGDEPIQIDLDPAWSGVAAMGQPDKLAEGLLSDAVNVRIDGVEPRTRPGVVEPPHCNGIVTTPWLAVGTWSDPNDREWILGAQSDRIWRMADGAGAQFITLPSGETLTGPGEFVGAFASVLFFRGKDKTPLIWSGDRRDPFRMASDVTYDDQRATFLSPPPPAEFAVVVADRVVVPIDRDTVACSDILDPTAFDLATKTIRFNQGDDDTLVALAAYQGNRLIAFKTQTIYYANNFVGDLSGLSVDRVPIDELGCVARKTVAQVGNDLMWLSHRGVFRLGQTDQGGIRILPEPVSRPVQRWIDRINWHAVAGSVATVAGDCYLLSVPLDGSATNNATLVYNLVSQAWQGIDYYGGPPPAMADTVTTSGAVDFYDPQGSGINDGVSSGALSVIPANASITADLWGRRCAYFVAGSRIFALQHEYGTADRFDGAGRPIFTRIVTRGYTQGSIRTNAIVAVLPILSTRNAELSISVQTEGVREVLALVTRRRRNRLTYSRHGMSRWNPGNAADDFARPYRNDYTWHVGDACRLGSGIPLGLVQEFDCGYPVRRLGRWFCIAVESRDGDVILRGMQVEGLADRNALHSQS